ncbi:MAG: type I methionyl aminopeptidase [Anaerolineae bacterium]|jgi:methionyl aminopeptidase|nr:type I methionyl aminopeptidase [Anaerolineae bacterium]
MAVIRKSPEELMIMREAGRITALALDAMRQAVRPGISTQELDEIAADVIRSHNATAAFLGYPPGSPYPYPATVTASINDELVHGIPCRDRILKEGDIISLDCGVVYEGFVGDSAFTMGVGKISDVAQQLLQVTEEALYVGIEQARAGNETRDISLAVQKYVESRGYGVVREYTGHGVGRAMHEEPQVPNWWPSGRKRLRGWNSVLLEPGIVFAIEPMVSVGKPATQMLDDHWTVVTLDGSLCAHFEHTVAITPDGPPIILTLP